MFGTELERQILDAGINKLELARRTGISHGQISKWVNGRQRGIPEEYLKKIALALSNRPEAHASLVRAHLEDHRYGPGASLVQIAVAADSPSKKKPPTPTEFERSIAFLVDHAKANKATRDMLLSVAKALGMAKV